MDFPRQDLTIFYSVVPCVLSSGRRPQTPILYSGDSDIHDPNCLDQTSPITDDLLTKLHPSQIISRPNFFTNSLDQTSQIISWPEFLTNSLDQTSLITDNHLAKLHLHPSHIISWPNLTQPQHTSSLNQTSPITNHLAQTSAPKSHKLQLWREKWSLTKHKQTIHNISSEEDTSRIENPSTLKMIWRALLKRPCAS